MQILISQSWSQNKPTSSQSATQQNKMKIYDTYIKHRKFIKKTKINKRHTLTKLKFNLQDNSTAYNSLEKIEKKENRRNQYRMNKLTKIPKIQQQQVIIKKKKNKNNACDSSDSNSNLQRQKQKQKNNFKFQIFMRLRLEETIYIPKKIISKCEEERKTVINWIVQACSVFGFGRDTLLLTINIFDRVLGTKKISNRTQLLQIGVASLHLAAKYEEVMVPPIFSFLKLVDEKEEIEENDVISMQDQIILLVKFQFGYVSPLIFVEQLSMIQKINEKQRIDLQNWIIHNIIQSTEMRYLASSKIASYAYQQLLKNQSLPVLQDQMSKESNCDSDFFYL